MKSFILNLKHASSMIMTDRSVSLSIIITMALSIGAMLFAIGLTTNVVFSSLPYKDQDSLYKVEHSRFNSINEPQFEAYSYPNLINLYNNEDYFSDKSVVFYNSAVIRSLTNQPLVNIGYTTGSFFDILGAQMHVGSALDSDIDLKSDEKIAVISYQMWSREFTSSKDILSEKINIDDVTYRIVGVLHKDFVEPELRFPGHKTQVWIPWFNHVEDWMENAWNYYHPGLVFFGKLKKGINEVQAEISTSDLVNTEWQDNVSGNNNYTGWYVKLEFQSFKDAILGDTKIIFFYLILGATGLLAVSIVNVTNLFVSRVASNEKNLAIKAAIGAKKSDLSNILFSEALVITSISSFIGLILAKIGFIVTFNNFAESIPRVEQLHINFLMILSSFVLPTIFSTIIMKLSLKMINYKSLVNSLSSGGKGTGIQVSQKLRNILLVTQIFATSLLIMLSVSLLKESLGIINKDFKFETEDTSYIWLSERSTDLDLDSSLDTDIDNSDLMSNIIRTFEDLPEVQSVSRSDSLLLLYRGFDLVYGDDASESLSVKGAYVDSKYFNLIDQKILSGDNFTEADDRIPSDNIIINRALADKLKAAGIALGGYVSLDGVEVYRITGIVETANIPNDSSLPYRIYLNANLPLGLLVKAEPNMRLSRERIIAILKGVTNRFALFDNVEDLSITADQRMFSQKVVAFVSSTLSVMIIFLSAVGLSGIINYNTYQRTTELATRLAIGAKQKDIVLLILKTNGKSIFIGYSIFLLFCVFLIIINPNILNFISINIVGIITSIASTAFVSIAICIYSLRKILNRPIYLSLRKALDVG